MDNPYNFLHDYAQEGAKCRLDFFEQNSGKIASAALTTALAIAKGNKLLLCGNGGSAADAQHVAGEFVNRFLLDRPGLPAIALTTDSSVITAIANDSAYDQIFARQVEALGKRGDVLFAISTSGKSANILAAIETARIRGLYVIGLTGCAEIMNPICDLCINACASSTPLVQELHLACEHVFCAIVDYYLFENPQELANNLK